MRLFVVVVFVALLPAFAVCTDVYVDPTHGNDDGDGSMAHPWKTLSKAQLSVRAMKPLSEPLTVNLRAGEYFPTAGVQAPLLNLSVPDSGTADAPITWRAYPGDTGAVRFMGGMDVPASAWKPWSGGAQGVVVANLTAALGLTPTEFSSIVGGGGLGSCNNNRMQLYVGTSPMTLARYPNVNLTSGYWQWDSIASVVDVNKAFTYSGDRPAQWAAHPNPNPAANPMFVHGYWTFGWADSRVAVSAIDTATRTITVAQPPVYGFKAKARWYAFNVLAELDQPGEYFLDVASGSLYFMPPAGFDPATMAATVSVVTTGIIMNTVSHVHLDGIAMSHGQLQGVDAVNVANVSLSNCDFSAQGEVGVSLRGADSVLQSSSVTDVGCKNVVVEGGDLTTLAPGNVTVRSSVLRRNSLWTRTYTPAISWGGCGNSYINNTISDGPHTAILGGGNNNLFQGNDISHYCYEVTDAGAYYSGRNWARRGNRIVGNSFSDIQNHVHTVLGAPSVQAIYFDDQLSGDYVINNTFTNCHKAVFIGGGRNHTVTGNTFINSGAASVHIDDRGLTWQKSYCTPPDGTFWQEMKALHYTQPPYATEYPSMLNITNDYPCVPVNNVVQDNRWCGSAPFTDFDITTANTKWHNSISGNTQFTSC